MRIPKCFTLLAVAMLPLLAGFSQTVDPSTTSPAKAPAILPSSADEVVRLTETPTTTVITPSEPPPPQVEVIPVSRGPDYLWTPGCWLWNGGAWIWFGGYWGHPTRP